MPGLPGTAKRSCLLTESDTRPRMVWGPSSWRSNQAPWSVLQLSQATGVHPILFKVQTTAPAQMAIWLKYRAGWLRSPRDRSPRLCLCLTHLSPPHDVTCALAMIDRCANWNTYIDKMVQALPASGLQACTYCGRMCACLAARFSHNLPSPLGTCPPKGEAALFY